MSAFESKQSMPKDAGARSDDKLVAIGVDTPKIPSDTPVKTMQTPADRYAYPDWPRYDAMDVRNLRRPRYGHNY